jgi:hypothetical protein
MSIVKTLKALLSYIHDDRLKEYEDTINAMDTKEFKAMFELSGFRLFRSTAEFGRPEFIKVVEDKLHGDQATFISAISYHNFYALLAAYDSGNKENFAYLAEILKQEGLWEEAIKADEYYMIRLSFHIFNNVNNSAKLIHIIRNIEYVINHTPDDLLREGAARLVQLVQEKEVERDFLSFIHFLSDIEQQRLLSFIDGDAQKEIFAKAGS